MNNKKMMIVTLTLFALLLTSACGSNANNGAATDNVNTPPAETNQENTPANENDATNANEPSSDEPTSDEPKADEQIADEQILIIIDQTEKPIDGNSFDFAINKLPAGYALAEMQWISKENLIVNSLQEAIQHGADGGEGFYISGNGQYSGFFYSDAMKGEVGQVVLLFKNEQGDELTWKKEITLN